MKQKTTNPRTILLAGAFLLLFFALTVTRSNAMVSSTQTPKWKLPLPARCSTPADCEISSPALADINEDGKLDIVVATSNGHVIAIRDNGSSGAVLWDRDVSPYFGMASNTQQINSSPAIADIDNDGKLEIVVGTGTIHQSMCTQGGVIVLDHNGVKQSGWPFFTHDEYIPPAGCTDSVFSTPALGDLDRDGDLEIVVSSFDKRIYVLHHNGTVDSNFPVDSEHITRFPTWGFEGVLADTIWASPSLADLDGDGYLDIIQATEEGNFGSIYPGGDPSWVCPYTLPSYLTPGYCGGALYVVDRFGNHLPGFPKRIYEAMQSSPAIHDINQDGTPEIFVGAGTFYYTNSPSNPTTNFRIYGWDHQGNDLPGWAGGKVTGGSTPASVAIGDIAGDSQKEIIALGMDKKLYAWYSNGTSVPGFPMMPLNEQGQGSTFNVGFSPILGDYDGDGKMEIFVYAAWAISIIDGNGQQLTTTSNPPNAPLYYTNAQLQNNPAVGDIDNDGRLELIANNSTLHVWDLPNAGNKADWPMFRQNAARTGYPAMPMLHITPSSLVALHEIDDSSDVIFNVVLKCDSSEAINWAANENHPDITLSSTSGSLMDTTTLTISVDRSGLSPGKNTVGTVLITGTINGENVVNSPASLPVTIYLVDNIHQVFLPGITR